MSCTCWDLLLIRPLFNTIRLFIWAYISFPEVFMHPKDTSIFGSWILCHSQDDLSCWWYCFSFKVTDLTNDHQGFKDDGNGTLAGDPDDDYTYDNYGNMTRDQNKGINHIRYNHMNLPVEIDFANNRKITYLYTAMGIKLQKTINYGSYQVTTDYRNGYQYETKPVAQGGRGYAELLFFPTAEGYVKALYPSNPAYDVPMKYQYIYIYKDHLGNNRLSYTLDPRTNHVKILEENNYYPFGLKHGNYNAIRKDVKYKEELASKKEIKQVMTAQMKFKYYYQEQERQDELGLNWDSFKYRNYDYAIGRFMSVDPLAEKYPYNSTYAFQENKLGLGRELEGLELGPKMEVFLANNNAPKLNMTVQEYLDKTKPIFYYHSPYNPNRNAEGRVIIDNNYQAIQHYYRGNGKSVVLGPKTVEMIKNSKDVQYYINRIKSGATTNPSEGSGLSVDMESLSRTFHLGKMTFLYKTTCKGNDCVTNITVDDKGFVDPNSIASYINPNEDDNKGPNHELGGSPYDYDPVKWTITFQNPGYEVDKNGSPKPMENKNNDKDEKE